jgi:hypothetical protein
MLMYGRVAVVVINVRPWSTGYTNSRILFKIVLFGLVFALCITARLGVCVMGLVGQAGV